MLHSDASTKAENKIDGDQLKKPTAPSLMLAKQAFIMRTLPDQKHSYYEIDVPDDGTCLFYSIALSALLPTLDNFTTFKTLYCKLFGSVGKSAEEIFQLLSTYDGTPRFIENNGYLIYLVDYCFRPRLVEFMQDQKLFFSKVEYTDSKEVFDTEMNRMVIAGTWGGLREIVAASRFLGKQIVVYEIKDNKLVERSNVEKFYKEILYLVHVPSKGSNGINNHYHYLIEPKYIKHISQQSKEADREFAQDQDDTFKPKESSMPIPISQKGIQIYNKEESDSGLGLSPDSPHSPSFDRLKETRPDMSSSPFKELIRYADPLNEEEQKRKAMLRDSKGDRKLSSSYPPQDLLEGSFSFTGELSISVTRDVSFDDPSSTEEKKKESVFADTSFDEKSKETFKEFYTWPKEAIQNHNLGWLTMQLGPKLAEQRKAHNEDERRNRLEWNKIKLQAALYNKARDLVLKACNSYEKIQRNEVIFNFHEQRDFSLRRQALSSITGEEKKEVLVQAELQRTKDAFEQFAKENKDTIDIRKIRESLIALEEKSREANKLPLALTRSRSVVESHNELQKFDAAKNAHLLSKANEAKIGNDYNELMSLHEKLLIELEGRMEEKYKFPTNRKKHPLILSPAQAEAFLDRLGDELEIEKEKLIQNIQYELDKEAEDIREEGRHFLKLDQVVKRYQTPLLSHYQGTLSSIKNSFVGDCQSQLAKGNLTQLAEKTGINKTCNQYEETLKKIAEEEKRFRRESSENKEKFIKTFEEQAKNWLKKNIRTLPASYLGQRKIPSIIDYITSRKSPANLAQLRDKDGNTLFHHLLAEYAVVAYNCKQKLATPADKETLKILSAMVELLYQYGFSPYYRNNNGLTAYAYANQQLETTHKLQNNDDYRLPDWHLNTVGLQYIPTFSSVGERLKAKLITYSRDAQKSLNSKWAWLFFNVAIKAIGRRDEVGGLAEKLYEATMELSDEGFIEEINSLINGAQRGLFNRSTLYNGLKRELDKIEKEGVRTLRMTTPYQDVLRLQDERRKEEKAQRDREAFQKDKADKIQEIKKAENASPAERDLNLLAEKNRKLEEELAFLKKKNEEANLKIKRLEAENVQNGSAAIIGMFADADRAPPPTGRISRMNTNETEPKNSLPPRPPGSPG